MVNAAFVSSGRITMLQLSVFNIPCTNTGNVISIASASFSASAFIRTTASPSFTTRTRQSNRFSPCPSITADGSAVPSITSNVSPSSSNTARTVCATSNSLCTFADSTTSSFSTKKRGACKRSIRSFRVITSTDASPTCVFMPITQPRSFHVVRLSGRSKSNVASPASSVSTAAIHTALSARSFRIIGWGP